MIKQFKTYYRKKELQKQLPDTDYVDGLKEELPIIAVNTKNTRQTFFGFGGAITNASVEVLSSCDKKTKSKIISDCFGEKGLNYRLGRVNLHSCDFASDSYIYYKDGKNASTFSFEREKDRIEVLKEIQKIRKGDIRFFASSWAPPAFMKSNNDMYYGGKLKKEFMAEYAEYFCLFIEQMKKNGINIDFTSVQNEPEAVQIWESCIFTAEEEGAFIKNYLLPAFKKHKIDTKLIIWDHNRDRIATRARVTLSDKELLDKVWGIGYHWYVYDSSQNIAVTKAMFPNKHILLTESCVELCNGDTVKSSGDNVYVGDISNGERYARNIINDFNNYSEGWIDWNICLNNEGGPNHVKNYCEAPIMVNNGNIIYNPSYYYIGHFSKFIKEGAKNVECFVEDRNPDLYATAFVNPDGKKVVVVLNQGWITRFALVIDGKTADICITDHSIMTLIID